MSHRDFFGHSCVIFFRVQVVCIFVLRVSQFSIAFVPCLSLFISLCVVLGIVLHFAVCYVFCVGIL